MRNEKKNESIIKSGAVAMVCVVALFILIYSINTRPQIPSVPYGYSKVVESIVIEDGDTLWDIANDYIEKYDMQEIYRTKDLVYEIKEINHISEDYIRAGNYVIVPYLTK